METLTTGKKSNSGKYGIAWQAWILIVEGSLSLKER